jgi:hypothetical protein
MAAAVATAATVAAATVGGGVAADAEGRDVELGLLGKPRRGQQRSEARGGHVELCGAHVARQCRRNLDTPHAVAAHVAAAARPARARAGARGRSSSHSDAC